jgi:DNA-binding response OmpR family regulator
MMMKNLGFLTKYLLETEGYKTLWAKDGLSGLRLFRQSIPDICLLDCMMPGMDGFTLASEIKKTHPKMPVIFLTARSMKMDKQTGFELGADDYITKPFDEDELIWRIQAILKRSVAVEDLPKGQAIQIGIFSFDKQNLSLKSPGQQQRLTLLEAKILDVLWQHRGNLIHRDDLLIEVYGEADYFKGRSLDVFITKWRKYLKSDSNINIENIPRVGFRMLVN